MTLFLNINRGVLTGKLAEVLGGCIQVLLDGLKPGLKEYALAMRGRSIQVGHEPVQFADVGMCDVPRSLGLMVGHHHEDDAALAVLRNLGIVFQLSPRIHPMPYAVYLFQIEMVYDSAFDGVA